jgi:hypothetical protein
MFRVEDLKLFVQSKNAVFRTNAQNIIQLNPGFILVYLRVLNCFNILTLFNII